MDELNEPASNFRLLQVDFYNILSPGNQLSRTDPLLSLVPLPKKSISISLEDGLQMGWAPNGYGKTFVFSNLLGLIQDHKEQSNLRRIESLEQKLINNLDENSYSELIKLKSQLNRE